MSNGWQEAYSELTGFIAEHSEVEIGASVISIPENVRPEFYRLFNAVRMALIEEKFPDFFDKGGLLSERYTKVEEEVNKLLGLEDISLPIGLHRFLHNPKDRLIRELFNPLFDLMKGKVDIEAFEQGASSNLETTFRDLYQSGYEKWVALSLVKLLEADRSLVVNVFRVSLDFGAHDREPIEPTAPMPHESKHLSFDHAQELFEVPDFIVHSAKVNGYIALRSDPRSEVGRPAFIADKDEVHKKREWYPLDSVGALESGLTLIYVADEAEEISLVADAEKICRPNLIIECREQKDWYGKQGLDKVKLHHDSLKPTLGTYIVSMEPVPEQAYKELVPEQVSKEPAPEGVSSELATEQILDEQAIEQEQKPAQEQEPKKLGEDIHILTVDFDQSKLEPIISKLVKQQGKGR